MKSDKYKSRLNLQKKKILINYLICKKDEHGFTVDDYVIDIIIDIISYGKNLKLENLLEIFKGAHVIIKNDNSFFYKRWKKLSTSYTGIKVTSSHSSIKKQLVISGGTLGKYSKNKEGFQILIGVSDKFKKNSTWLQIERSALFHKDDILKGFINLVNHMMDFVMYTITDKNIGPNGKSKYTDIKPLIITLYDDYENEKRRKKYMKKITKSKNTKKYERKCNT